MGSKLPTWSAEYETGVKAIDSDHKALFEEIKRLAVALVEGHGEDAIDQAITCLENYVHEHFSREEHFMFNAGYPRVEDHIRSHRALTRKVALLRQLNRDQTAEIDPLKLTEFLSNWLSHHILEIDMDYVPYLHGDAADREPGIAEKLHEVNVHVPANKSKVVEDFLQIILSDHPLALELTELIEQFEKRMEEHDLAEARSAFCKK